MSKHWLNVIGTKGTVTHIVHQLTLYFATQSMESMAMVSSSTRTRIVPVPVDGSDCSGSGTTSVMSPPPLAVAASSSASSASVAASSSSLSNPGATISISTSGVAAVAKAKAKSKAKAKAKAHALPPVVQIRGQHMGPLSTVNNSFLTTFDNVVALWRYLRLAQRTHRVVNGYPIHTATPGSKMEFDQ